MTQLSPLEETLFKHWATANGVENHDKPDNAFDHRALYKQSNGLVQPPGAVNHMATQHNQAMGTGPEAKAEQAHADAQQKLVGDKLKIHHDNAMKDLEIGKAKQTLEHLMMKRKLGV